MLRSMKRRKPARRLLSRPEIGNEAPMVIGPLRLARQLVAVVRHRRSKRG